MPSYQRNFRYESFEIVERPKQTCGQSHTISVATENRSRSGIRRIRFIFGKSRGGRILHQIRLEQDFRNKYHRNLRNNSKYIIKIINANLKTFFFPLM